MKLVRYGNPGKEKPGLIDAEGKLRDLSAHLKDIGPAQLSDAALAKLRKLKTASLPLVKGSPRMGCPVMPAQLTRISTAECRFCVCCTAAATLARSPTSTTTVFTCAPRSAFACPSAATLMSHIVTKA